jgi:hypothetical protein
VPAAQAAQLPPELETVPLVQAMQRADPAPDDVPAGHVWQLMLSPVNVPPGQLTHVPVLASAIWPAAQVWQITGVEGSPLMPVMVNGTDPSGHGSHGNASVQSGPISSRKAICNSIGMPAISMNSSVPHRFACAEGAASGSIANPSTVAAISRLRRVAEPMIRTHCRIDRLPVARMVVAR